MASTVLVKDVIWKISVLMQDHADQFARWPEAELVKWLDDAQLAIVKYLPLAGSAIFSYRLAPGSLQSIERMLVANVKKWNGVAPAADVLGIQLLKVYQNMGEDGLTPGDAIRIIEGDILDSQTPSWRTIAKTKVRSFVFDPAFPLHFEVSPAVHASTPVWVRLGMTAMPAKIPYTGTPEAPQFAYADPADETTTLSVSDEFEEEVINYVVARANMKDTEYSDGNKSNFFGGLFTDQINAKAKVTTGFNPNLTRLPFAPEPVAAAK